MVGAVTSIRFQPNYDRFLVKLSTFQELISPKELSERGISAVNWLVAQPVKNVQI